MFRLPLLVLSLCLMTTSFARAQDDDFDNFDMDNVEAPVKKKTKKPKPAATEESMTAPSEETAPAENSDESLIDESDAPKPKKKKKKKKKSSSMAGMKKKRTKKSHSGGQTDFWHAALGYSMGGSIKFSGDHESTITPGGSVSATYKVGGAIEVSGGYMHMPQGLGYGATLSYQMKRKITGITIDGQTYEPDGSGVQVILLEGFGIYRFDDIYIPFGLNFGLPSYSGESNGASTDVKGDIGFQVGVGKASSEGGLFYEGDVKMIGIQSQTKGTTDTFTFKTAYLMALGVKVGYLF